MIRLLKTLVWLGALVLCAALSYGWSGYRAATSAAPQLAAAADAAIAAGQGGASLGLDRQGIVVAVEDPAFFTHIGFDLTTPGAGHTTLTQSLPAPEGMVDMVSGLQRLRQTGYAIGLDRVLTKPQIMALFLTRVPMGRGPDGAPVTGIFAASQAHYADTPDRIAMDDFIRLVAAMADARNLAIGEADAALTERTARIKALIAGTCAPANHADIWLAACATQ